MKLKDAARLGMLIETEGCIQVHRPYQRKGLNCLSSPHIGIDITNTDMGILSWTKTILEKELEHEIRIYPVSNSSKIRTKQSYRLVISKFDDVLKVLNITRGLMLGIKKRVADLVCSFLDYRNTLNNTNGYTRDEKYNKAFNTLIDKVNKIKATYDQIKPVTTVHGPDESQKIQSELIGNNENFVETQNSLSA